MKNVKQIIDAIERKKLISILGVVPSAVSNAEKDGVFPSSWYKIIKAECDDINKPLPLCLFNFKKYKNKIQE